jgi:hypothetical protein
MSAGERKGLTKPWTAKSFFRRAGGLGAEARRSCSGVSMSARVGFSTDGHRPTLQFAFQMILLPMILPFFRQFTEYLHGMS